VAGISIDEQSLKLLKNLGVKDSKVLSATERESIHPEILKLCVSVLTSHAEPAEIDRYVRVGKKYRRLNFLEARHMAKIIDAMSPEEVFVDAPDANPVRFARELGDLMSCKPRIIAEHKADRNYVVVSAASIVAKVERDRAVELLRREHGEFGSGYPSDEETIDYLRRWVEREGAFPPFARRSWKTWDRILAATLVP
jgi:ribonuclease HII